MKRMMSEKKTVKLTVTPVIIGAFGKVTKGTGTETGGLGNKKMRGDYLNYSIIKIEMNTVKSIGEVSRLAVIRAPERNHQLSLV